MLEDLADDHPWREDIQTIVNETLRCRKIVKGLLDFSRQTKPSARCWTSPGGRGHPVARAEPDGVPHIKIVYDLDPHLPPSWPTLTRCAQSSSTSS